ELQQATDRVFDEQDEFLRQGRFAEVSLYILQNAAIISAMAYGVFTFGNEIDTPHMTPREYIGLWGSIIGFSTVSYWAIWDKLKLIEPFKKWILRRQHEKVTQAWVDYLKVYPPITART